MFIQPHQFITHSRATLTRTMLAGIVAAGLLVSLPALAERSNLTFELSAADEAQAMADALQGKAYQDGASVPQNYGEAARLYRSSASKGLALGQYYLGFLYVAGLGVPQDYVEATRWL
ncbi:MAG: sel1 repeat family protein, partial [Nitrospirales bacterium]|nr:sel1 repeat family protein [Nitrospirales bacterium]